MIHQRRLPMFSTLLFTLVLSPRIVAQDWPSYGGDNGSQKYSILDQINSDNVSELELAWEWESVDNPTVAANLEAGNNRAVPAAYKATPIVVDGVMYVSTSFGRIVALDAFSGEQKWSFDTAAWEAGRPMNLGYNTRGVAHWQKADKQRLFFATYDSYLWSIDLTTGKPDPDFGENGRVDLVLGLGRDFERRLYGVISPPLVTNDRVIVNSAIHDSPQSLEMPPGDVRAFDPETGEVIWAFHTIPQAGEYGHETWENGSAEYTGNTNSWTIMSADDELGIVYIPIGTPTNDWYGGKRLGDNLFAESLVAVRADTGERIWHFQTVHHGLWDYDLPAAPTLVDITVDGRPVQAVAQISKQGFTYVFDRITGEPVWPIEERAVPPSTVPGEVTSPTQPFPTKPLPFEPQGISDATLIDYTPALRQEALQIIEEFDYGPLFTPPTLRGTIQFPGWGGGAEWHGAAFDRDTGLYYIPSASVPIVVQLREARRQRVSLGYVRGGAMSVGGPQGLPLTKPPYSRVTAIDLNTGEHEWMIPHGEGPRQQIIEMGILDPGPVGSVSRTGPVLTKTLLFLAQSDGGQNLLRAFDKATGAVVHEAVLPLPPAGTPMTYMVNGKQFISIAVGGGQDSRLVSLSLP